MKLNRICIIVISVLSFLILIVGCGQTQESKKEITTNEPAKTQAVEEQKTTAPSKETQQEAKKKYIISMRM